MCLGFLFPRSEILFLRQICILKAFSHCSIFIALEYYNMENIWKSSGVYKKTGSTKMAMVRIFTSRGHLSVKKQSSCAEVGFTQVCRKRKNNGWATLFFFSVNCFASFWLFYLPKDCSTAAWTFAGIFPSFLLSWDMMMWIPCMLPSIRSTSNQCQK